MRNTSNPNIIMRTSLVGAVSRAPVRPGCSTVCYYAVRQYSIFVLTWPEHCTVAGAGAGGARQAGRTGAGGGTPASIASE